MNRAAGTGLLPTARLAWVVLRKELIDSLRDRRSVAIALLFPMLTPVLAFIGVGVGARSKIAAGDLPLALPVAGAEHAPQLLRYLAEHQVELEPAPADPAAAVRDGRQELVLLIPADFGQRLRSGKPAAVEVLCDTSREATRFKLPRLQRLIAGYGYRLGDLRLLARGVDPTTAAAIVVEELDQATPRSRAAQLFGMFPLLLFMAIVMGGFYVATDITAGERERQSLEPLLLNPVPRAALVAGKYGATCAFAGAALGLELLSLAVAAPLARLEVLGLTLDLSLPTVAAMAGVLAPLVALLAALMLLVAAQARTYRQAQATLSVLMLVPMIAPFIQLLAPQRPAAWMLLVPTLGETQLVSALLRGAPIMAGEVALLAGAELAYTLLVLAYLTRHLAGPRLLSGS